MRKAIAWLLIALMALQCVAFAENAVVTTTTMETSAEAATMKAASAKAAVMSTAVESTTVMSASCHFYLSILRPKNAASTYLSCFQQL